MELQRRNATFVLATWDGAGNFAPERALVRALVARGHAIHVLSWDSHADAVKADGATFVPLEGVRQDASNKSYGGREWMIANVLMGKGYGSNLTRAIERLKPDVVLVDFVLHYALRSATSSALPSVALGHTIYSPLRDAPVGRAVEACNRVLIFSYRELDPAATFSENVKFVTPFTPLPPRGPVQPLQKPSVVVSLSSAFQNQARLIQMLCDVLGDIDVDALVTIGHAFSPQEFSAGANVRVEQFVPHEQVLPRTDLLVTHAGHGTVMAGMRFGVPMLCVPMGSDQPFVASQALRLGVCRKVDQNADAPTLKQAIVEALADQALSACARRVAAVVAATPGLDYAVTEVEALI